MNYSDGSSGPLACATEPAHAQDRSAESSNCVRLPSQWPIAILGVPFDPVTTGEALRRIEDMIASRTPHYVVTANVDFLVQSRRDVELQRILIEADLVLCDGAPVVWASRWLGNALPERVAGSDLVPHLLRDAARHGHRVFLLGAAPGVAAAAAERLQLEQPGLRIVGHHAPPMSALLDMDHEGLVQLIRASAPDILLVSFGCPKQEKWIAMHYRALGVPVCIGVGATIDFLAGRVKRAPGWMQRCGCEWLYRLLQEPRRLYRRYTMDAFGFGPALAGQLLAMAGNRVKAAAAPALDVSGPAQVIFPGLELTRSALDRHASFWRALPNAARHCIFDVSNLRRFDAAGIGLLVKWRKALGSSHLVLVGASARFRTALQDLRLTELFAFADSVGGGQEFVAALPESPLCGEDARRIMVWRGEVTAANIDGFWERTSESVRNHASERLDSLTVDLSAVRFIDSSAAWLMVRVRRLGKELHVKVRFTRPRPNVRNVLRIARLDHLLLEEER